MILEAVRADITKIDYVDAVRCRVLEKMSFSERMDSQKYSRQNAVSNEQSQRYACIIVDFANAATEAKAEVR